MHLNCTTPMNSTDLRNTLAQLMPKRAVWSAKDLWNVRLLAKRFKNLLLCQELFNNKVLPAISSIFTPHPSDALDEVVDDVLDPALQFSHELHHETLEETVDNEHSRFMVGLFLHKLKQSDGGFMYEVFYADDGD